MHNMYVTFPFPFPHYSIITIITPLLLFPPFTYLTSSIGVMVVMMVMVVVVMVMVVMVMMVWSFRECDGEHSNRIMPVCVWCSCEYCDHQFCLLLLHVCLLCWSIYESSSVSILSAS